MQELISNLNRYAEESRYEITIAQFRNGIDYVADTTSATGVLAMRNACKNILYIVVNSRAYDTDSTMSMENWQIVLIVVDCIVAAVVIGAEILTVRGYKKRKNPVA